MNPTTEMIEAARKAYVTELPETALYPSEFAMRAALTAAIALIPGEPVAWQWRQTYAGRWGNWNDCGLSTTDVQKWRDLAEKLSNEVQVRPLYAAPAPLPVAVKALEWNGAGNNIYASTPFGPYAIRHNTTSLTTFPLELVIPGEKVATQFFYFEDRAKAAAQADYESRILSALSYTAGGTEEELTDDQLKTTVEICRSAAEDMIKANIQWRLDPRYILRLCDAVSSYPIPASDIAALQKAFDQRTDKLLELVEENGLLKGRAATNEQALASYKSEIAALREGNDPLFWMRLGARAMRLSARAACGNHWESSQEDAMTSGGLSKLAKEKLYAEANASEEISRVISEKCEDSALGYASYMGDEADRKLLADQGVTSDWLYRHHTGEPSRKELSDRSALSQQEESRG